jgi:hypothetical protein
MEDNGYKIQHSSVIHGINSVEGKIADDKDYLTIVKEIDKAVFI